MSTGIRSRASTVHAERRREAHLLCATLADLLAGALQQGDQKAANRYAQDLERVERVARDTPSAPIMQQERNETPQD